MKSFAFALLATVTLGALSEAQQKLCDAYKANEATKDDTTSAAYKAACEEAKTPTAEESKKAVCDAYKALKPDDTSSDSYKAACPDGATNVTAFAATMAAAVAALAF